MAVVKIQLTRVPYQVHIDITLNAEGRQNTKFSFKSLILCAHEIEKGSSLKLD